METGLDYFGARYNSSAQGRFTSPDPSNLSVTWSDPQSWNRYAYALNNPHRFVDNNGLWPTYIHNKIIEEAFPGLSKSEIQTLQKASYDTDYNNRELGMDPQDPHVSYIHGMSDGTDANEINAIALAESLGDRFIDENLAAAVVAQRDWIASGHTGLCPKALTAFGNAAHTVMDRTSPAHRGYQRWSGVGFLGIPGLVHFLRESWATRSERQGAEQQLQILFWQTFGSESSQYSQDGRTPEVTSTIIYNPSPAGPEGPEG